MKFLVMLVFGAVAVLSAAEPPTIAEVTAKRLLWPKEVTVNVAHEIPIIVNGKPSGSMQAPGGRAYPLQSVNGTEVVVDALGSPMNFPIADTDLLARAGRIQDRLAEAAQAKPSPTAPPTVAAAPSATPSPSPVVSVVTNKLAGELTGDLVILEGRKFETFDAASLGGKKYLAIYFSAGWCPPCRAFTPGLVKWYKRKKSQLEDFDIIFVSSDKTEEAMQAYMKDDKMTWPAVAYGKKSGSPLRKYSGRGIPCLVVIDAAGKVISDSYEGDDYVGPTKVLKDLDKLLKGS